MPSRKDSQSHDEVELETDIKERVIRQEKVSMSGVKVEKEQRRSGGSRSQVGLSQS